MKMNKNVLLLLPAAFAIGYFVKVRENTFSASAAETYSSPAAVLKSIPSGGKSRFYGAVKLKFEGDEVFAHVYDTKKTDSSRNRASYGVQDYAPNERAFQVLPLRVTDDPTIYYGVQRCALDLFARRKNGNLQHVNSIQCNYVRFVNTHFKSSETVGVTTTWLDPKQKKIPIINIDFRDEGVAGPIGTNMLVIFPKGLDAKAVAEGFGYGADNASTRNGWGWRFKGTDAKGYLTVESEHTESRAESIKSKTTQLRWSGSYFVPVAPTSKK